MRRILAIFMICMVGTVYAVAMDPQAAARYLREAEYYRKQAESYERDADSYLRQAKSADNEAEYYLRNKKYEYARDYLKRAANAIDNYQTKINSARNAASKAEDYMKKAADALR